MSAIHFRTISSARPRPMETSVASVSGRFSGLTCKPAVSRTLTGVPQPLSASRSIRSSIIVAAGEVAAVEELVGVRMRVKEDSGKPLVEYLVRWKDGAPNTWEPATNLSNDLLRDFESKWWATCRKGDVDAMKRLLAYGKRVLARTVDENRRHGLHFAAAIGRVDCCQALIQAGADVNSPDVEGYTPLHMAAGYMSTATVQCLLDAGADPEQKDKKGRSPLELIDSLIEQLPKNNPMLLTRRVALQEVARILTDNLYEDVPPDQILAAREAADGTRDFLVQWSDGPEPSWVSQRFIADDIIQDYDDGLEYAEAVEVIQDREADGLREYLVRWSDGSEPSWEPRRNLSEDVLGMYEAKKRGEDYKPRAKEVAAVPGGGAGMAAAAAGGAPGSGAAMAAAM